MSENWIREAIAEQEEHIRRSTSCRGVIGVSHKWGTSTNSQTGATYEACTVCGVTRTSEDYAARLATS